MSSRGRDHPVNDHGRPFNKRLPGGGVLEGTTTLEGRAAPLPRIRAVTPYELNAIHADLVRARAAITGIKPSHPPEYQALVQLVTRHVPRLLELVTGRPITAVSDSPANNPVSGSEPPTPTVPFAPGSTESARMGGIVDRGEKGRQRANPPKGGAPQ